MGSHATTDRILSDSHGFWSSGRSATIDCCFFLTEDKIGIIDFVGGQNHHFQGLGCNSPPESNSNNKS